MNAQDCQVGDIVTYDWDRAPYGARVNDLLRQKYDGHYATVTGVHSDYASVVWDHITCNGSGIYQEYLKLVHRPKFQPGDIVVFDECAFRDYNRDYDGYFIERSKTLKGLVVRTTWSTDGDKPRALVELECVQGSGHNVWFEGYLKLWPLNEFQIPKRDKAIARVEASGGEQIVIERGTEFTLRYHSQLVPATIIGETDDGRLVTQFNSKKKSVVLLDAKKLVKKYYIEQEEV